VKNGIPFFNRLSPMTEMLCTADERTCVDIEILFEEIIESDNDEKASHLFEALLDHWVYFYFHETNNKDTKPGKGNVDVVIFTGKDNPINVPMVEDKFGRNGVVYTNSDLALRLAEFDCKVGKMRGIKAFEMFYATKEFGGLYIQADCGHIHLNKEKVAEVIGKNA
jgi:hypothetical protein